MAEKKILDKQKREHQNYDSILLLNKNGTLDLTKPSFRNNSLRYRGFLRLNRKKVSRIVFLIIYFLCIYAILFGIMTGLLIIVLQLIISEDKPYLTGLQSPLNLAPGLSHRPNINFMTSLIAYESSNPQSYMPYVQNLRTFFSLYEEVNIKPQDGFATCENGVKTPNIPRLVCKFYPIVLESCVKENNFGYDRSEPCVAIKINKVYGWLPDIQNMSMSQSPLLRCFGRYESNFEVFGSLHYYPNVTIDGIVYVYFPYIIQYAYRSPVVAVQVKNVQRNGLFFLTCRLFNLNTPTEPLNFEFLID